MACFTSMGALEVILQRFYRSGRHTVDWGLNALKTSFRRVPIGLPADVPTSCCLIALCCNLLNLETRRLWRNQMRPLYNSHSFHVSSDGNGLEMIKASLAIIN